MSADDSSSQRVVRTVTGPCDPVTLGVTLMHEHVIHRVSVHSGQDDNTCIDTELIVNELADFRAAGGGCIVDVTPISLGRDPQALKQVSEQSGVPIVSAVGLYMLEVWPAERRSLSRDELADLIVKEVEGGATGVSAGLIGEIASHNEPDHADWRRYRLTDEETKVFHAVADAQQRTGLFISTHASVGRHGVAQLRAIADAGGDTRRVVVGHCDAQAHDDVERDTDYYHALLDFGAMLEFDMFGWTELLPDTVRVDRVARLVREGFADRLLLATDTCRRSQLHAFGGRGFDHILTDILPALRAAGVDDRTLRRMTVDNPITVLATGV